MMTDWGSVPSWLALAGGITAAASYAAGRRDTVKREASRVHAHPLGSYTHSSADDGFYKCEIRNAGDSPIFEVRIAYWYLGKRRWFWRFRRFDRRMTGERLPGQIAAAISPHETCGEIEFTGLRMEPPTTTWLSTPVVLVFRDGNGRQWVRWPDGRLNRSRDWYKPWKRPRLSG